MRGLKVNKILKLLIPLYGFFYYLEMTYKDSKDDIDIMYDIDKTMVVMPFIVLYQILSIVFVINELISFLVKIL